MRLFILGSIFSMCSFMLWTGCGSEGTKGPLIDVGLNTRQLCNFGVIAKEEVRCEISDHCNVGAIDDRYCWTDPPGDYQQGFCRQCIDNDCSAGLECDHRWCHLPCDQSSDCDTGEYCTAGFCRKPHTQGTQFVFSNIGDQDLTVYINQTKLVGESDACAFSRWEWSPAGQETVVLSPGEESLFLSVKFTPPDVGEYRAILEIHSNTTDTERSPMLLLFCGQAVEVVCSPEIDGTCPECASCTYDDFKDMIDQPPDPPDCSEFD